MHKASTAFVTCDTTKPANDFFTKLGINKDLLKTQTGVYTLENGGKSMITRFWLWENSKATIDIQHYIFKRDNTGLLACDYLVCAADRGVKVRILLDEIAVKQGTKEMCRLDAHENIEIRIYNPGYKLAKNPISRCKKLFLQFGKLQKRMHIKTITIDGEVAIMGGRNIADEYFDYDHHYNFHDRDIVMIGKKAKEVSATFNDHWTDTLSIPLSDLVKIKGNTQSPTRYEKLHKYACDTANFSNRMRTQVKEFPKEFKSLYNSGEFVWLNEMSFVADAPGKNEHKKSKKGSVSTDSIIAILKQAKTSVIIQSPYVILTESSEELFKQLIQKGIKIKILTNSLSSTDNDEAFGGYQKDRDKLLKMGIEIYEFKPDAALKYKMMIPEIQSKLNYKPVYGLHSKTMIIDNAISVIGTYNFDPRSANLNTECIAIIRSVQVTKNLLKYINQEFLPENAWKVTCEFNPDTEADNYKRVKVNSRKFVPKKIL